MSVARFCVCGFLLPAGSSKPCPACGRDTTPRSVPPVSLPPVRGDSIPIAPAQPLDRPPPTPKKPLAYQTVEVNDDGQPVYDFDGPVNARSAAEDAERLRRAKIRRNVAQNDDWLEREEAISRIRSHGAPIGTLGDCIQFPFNSIVWVLFLALAWGGLLVIGAFFLWIGYYFVEIFIFAAGLFVLGFTHRIFQYAYASSCAGKAELLGWPTFRPRAELEMGLRGLAGLLAGPIPVAGLAIWFWLNSGRLEVVDQLILVELTALSLSWWLLVIVASHEFGSVSPRAILTWFDTYGWLPLGAIFGAMSLASIFLWFAFTVLGFAASIAQQMTVLLVPAIGGIIALVLLLLRWLGVRRRKLGMALPPATPAPAL